MSNGISSNLPFHLSQIFSVNRFQLYDYGSAKNIQKYGQFTPPRVNFTLVTTPKQFFYGTEDRLLPEEFVNASVGLTTNVKNVIRVDTYNHVNFVRAYSLKEKVFDVIRDFIISYN